MTETNQPYTELYDTIHKFFLLSTNGELNTTNIPTLVRYGMELLQTGKTWQKMVGSQKKDLLVSVVASFARDLNKDKHLDSVLLETVLSLLPMIIDSSVDFAKTFTTKKFYCC